MVSADPGSFRDPASRIVYDDDRVLRLLDARGLAAWNSLKTTDFLRRATEDGRVISSIELDESRHGSAGVLQHPRLPLVSYPYEWTFTMLKDAALLQLDLLAEALAEDITIKDATPFNIQFVSGRPVFIDVGSFEPYVAGEPWIGYRQFTRQFLFPLMLHAWADLPFQPWLRGDMEGPTAAQVKRMLPLRKRMRPSTFLHVSLQARMEERLSGEAVRQDLKEAGFSSDLILINVRKLRVLIESLEWNPDLEGWSEYHECTHVGRDRDAKSQFLAGVLERVSPSRVVDLGANDGHFSGIAADFGSLAIAVDADEPVIDDFYKRSRGRDVAVVMTDLTNPTPSQGWAGQERPAFFERAQPDLVIAYGVIHHLIYTASIPPSAVLAWLRSFDCPIALEFVSPDDEMVTKLTANKLNQELHSGRAESEFRQLLTNRFEISNERALDSGTRVLFELRPI